MKASKTKDNQQSIDNYANDINDSGDITLSTDFEYPAEELPQDILDEIDRKTNEIAAQKLYEVMNRLLHILKDERKPHIFLALLMKGTKSNSQVAKELGITRQALNKHDKKFADKLFKKVMQIDGGKI